MTLNPLIDIIRIDTRESITTPGAESAIIPEEINTTIDKALESVWESHGRLVYTLEVHAISKKVAVMRSKGFVRRRNPFEPSRVMVTSAEEEGGMTYIIAVGVSKGGD